METEQAREAVKFRWRVTGLLFPWLLVIYLGIVLPLDRLFPAVNHELVAIALIVLLRRFPSVLDYTTFAIVLATMADTTALYALRWRRPDLHRPYRAWGYPLLPAAYIVANCFIALTMLRGRPFECGIALAVAATALPFYALFVRRRPSPPAPRPDF